MSPAAAQKRNRTNVPNAAEKALLSPELKCTSLTWQLNNFPLI